MLYVVITIGLPAGVGKSLIIVTKFSGCMNREKCFCIYLLYPFADLAFRLSLSKIECVRKKEAFVLSIWTFRVANFFVVSPRRSFKKNSGERDVWRRARKKFNIKTWNHFPLYDMSTVCWWWFADDLPDISTITSKLEGSIRLNGG